VHISSIEAWCKISFNGYYSNPLYYACNLYLNGELVTELVIPEVVTSIGKYAFYNCSSLTRLIIGANVDSYGSDVFFGCNNIKELVIKGSTMPEITSDKLTSITLYSPIPQAINAFADKVYRNATLYVPQGTKEAYRAAEVWKNFWKIEETDVYADNEIYLTINLADNGCIRQHITSGESCTYTFVAAEGWRINAVTYNGNDVTSQLINGTTFITPAIHSDAVLNVAYVKEGSAIAAATASRIKVQGHQGTISIAGAAEGAAIGLYTTSGTLVATAIAEGDTTHLTVPTGQVYIVTVGDTVVKIGM
jgi:hypothetical protein